MTNAPGRHKTPRIFQAFLNPLRGMTPRMDRADIRRLWLLAFVPLALAGCDRKDDGQQNLDSLDRELTNNVADPALTTALRDQIMVDPRLTQSSNANAVRPPSRPATGAVPADATGARSDGVDPRSLSKAPAAARDCPDCKAREGALTLGELAARQQGGRGCATQVAYSAGWANRLPADVPLYPDARVQEAAGTDANGCALRVVTFASTAPVARVIDWYYTRTSKAGYTTEHQAGGTQHILGGTRGNAAFVVYASPRQGGGTTVDLIANTH